MLIASNRSRGPFWSYPYRIGRLVRCRVYMWLSTLVSAAMETCSTPRAHAEPRQSFNAFWLLLDNCSSPYRSDDHVFVSTHIASMILVTLSRCSTSSGWSSSLASTIMAFSGAIVRFTSLKARSTRVACIGSNDDR
jgi:hypothetical protein